MPPTPHQLFLFFFQADDGIRDGHVTGVHTCALPICQRDGEVRADGHARTADVDQGDKTCSGSVSNPSVCGTGAGPRRLGSGATGAHAARADLHLERPIAPPTRSGSIDPYAGTIGPALSVKACCGGPSSSTGTSAPRCRCSCRRCASSAGRRPRTGSPRDSGDERKSGVYAWRCAPGLGAGAGRTEGLRPAPGSRLRSGQVPLLVGATVAVPDGQLGAVGGVARRVVQAPPGLRTGQSAAGLALPHLGTGTVAVPQLYESAVGDTATRDVHALAQRPQRPVRAHRPVLRVGPVAVVQLHRCAVRGVRRANVDTLAGDTGDRTGGHMPLLIHRTVAVPDDQLGTVGGVARRVVQTPPGLRVTQRAVGLHPPHLSARTVAVPQLHQRAVGGTPARDVHALAQRPQRSVRAHRPLLGVGAVAVVELDRCAVGGAGRAHVDTLTTDTRDRTGPPGRRRRAAAALGVRRHVVHEHGYAGLGGGGGASAEGGRERAAIATLRIMKKPWWVALFHVVTSTWLLVTVKKLVPSRYQRICSGETLRSNSM